MVAMEGIAVALAESGVAHGVNLPAQSRAYAVADSDTTIPATVNHKPILCRSDSPDPSKQHSENTWSPSAPAVLVHNRRKRLATHAGDQRSRAGTNSQYAIVVSSEARVSHVCTERHLSKRGRSMICLRMVKVSWKSGACKSLKSLAKRRA
jgi:hypothetical protein